jgi:gliding motility-associated-like protein
MLAKIIKQSMKTSLATTFLIFGTLVSLAQKQGNHWYFGFGAGLDFSSGSPIADTLGKLNTYEGCASISNKAGNLLFYTDGITVYNRNHQIMPNGNGLQGSPSATQSALIIKKPGSESNYYIFATYFEVYGGMSYSEVDMRLNGGLGDIITTKKNINLLGLAGESLLAIKHANNLFTWILSVDKSTNIYSAFLVNCDTVVTTPVTSLGSSSYGNAASFLSVSPKWNKIAATFTAWNGNSGLEVFDFDNATGILSNKIVGVPGSGFHYSTCFSPDGNLLYVSTSNLLLQMNVNAGSNILLSSVVISSRSSQHWGLQIGPDKKIYLAHYGGIVGFANADSLSVISSPNTLGLGCNFQYQAISLGGRMSQAGLPSVFLDYLIPQNLIKALFFCKGASTLLSMVGDSAAFTGAKWNFGDPTTAVNNSSTHFNTAHSFSDTGTYNVTLIRYFTCGSDTTTTKVRIVNGAVTATITGTAKACKNTHAILTGAGGYTYSWTGPNSFKKDTVALQLDSLKLNGTYLLTVRDSFGCKDTQSIVVQKYPVPIAIANSNSPVKIGNNILLSTDTLAGIVWSGPSAYTSATQNPIITNAQIVNKGIYTLIKTNIYGCKDTATTVVDVYQPEIPNNGIDDDKDSLIDCADPDLATRKECYCGNDTLAWKRLKPEMGYNRAIAIMCTKFDQHFTVPTGVTSLKIKAWGAGGGNGLFQAIGGVGAYSFGKLTVTPNDELQLIVGEAGEMWNVPNKKSAYGGGGIGGIDRSFNYPSPTLNNPGLYPGAGGGGRSAVVKNNIEKITAGAGGGAASSSFDGDGGAGGGLVGANADSLYPGYGLGGTQTTGGLGGVFNVATGKNGIARMGGSGGMGGINDSVLAPGFVYGAGGGGGGGYYGGGGGQGATAEAYLAGGGTDMRYNDAAGGGGSSYIVGVTSGGFITTSNGILAPNTTDVHYIAGTAGSAENGLLVIQWYEKDTLILSATKDTLCIGDTLTLRASSTFKPTLYTWSPTATLTGITDSVKIAKPTANVTYKVTSTYFNCVDSAKIKIVVNPLPVANITINKKICAGKTIVLKGTGGKTYNWQGPNSFVSVDSTVTITKANLQDTGKYTLIVSNKYNCVDTATIKVNVNVLPIPSINNTTACQGDSTAFTNTSTITTGNIVKYYYSYGDGALDSVITKAIKKHLYATAGNYTALLIAKSDSGCINADTVKVRVGALPNITFTNKNNTTCFDSCNASIKASATLAIRPYTYVWKNNSINVSTDSLLTKACASKYVLTVKDSLGCTSKDSVTFTKPTKLVASVTNYASVCKSASATLTAGATGGTGAYTYAWDTLNVTSNTLTLAPIQTNVYTVTVKDANNCTSTDSGIIYINPVPVVNFGVSPVCAGVNSAFNDSTTIATGAIKTYGWTFGVGAAGATIKSPFYTYANCGTYTVGLTVVSDSGCQAQNTKPITIYCFPSASFTAINGCEKDDAILCTNTSVLNSISGNFNWTYGDGKLGTSNQTQPNTSHVYATANNYSIKLLVTNKGLCKDSSTVNITVYPKPQANFSSTIACIGQQATELKDSSRITAPSTITNWYWNKEYATNFSTDVSGVATTNNVYTTTTAQAALVVVSNFNCKDTIIKPLQFYTLPTANFTTLPSVTSILNPDFTLIDSSSYGKTITWNFGDKDSIVKLKKGNVVHVYKDSGTYTITQTVINKQGCVAKHNQTVVVKPNVSIYVPNAFTPDGDKHNEYFNARGEGITALDLRIYDRWGTLVSTIKDIKAKGWDGTDERTGKPCQQEVYVWKLTYKDIFNYNHTLQGTVTLMR